MLFPLWTTVFWHFHGVKCCSLSGLQWERFIFSKAAGMFSRSSEDDEVNCLLLESQLRMKFNSFLSHKLRLVSHFSFFALNLYAAEFLTKMASFQERDFLLWGGRFWNVPDLHREEGCFGLTWEVVLISFHHTHRNHTFSCSYFWKITDWKIQSLLKSDNIFSGFEEEVLVNEQKISDISFYFATRCLIDWLIIDLWWFNRCTPHPSRSFIAHQRAPRGVPCIRGMEEMRHGFPVIFQRSECKSGPNDRGFRLKSPSEAIKRISDLATLQM